MDANDSVSAILRKARGAAVVLTAAAMTAASFHSWPRMADAGGPSTQEQTRIAIAENAEATADIVLFNSNPNMVGMTKNTDLTAKDEADEKHKNYANDHVPVVNKVAPGRETNDYIKEMTDLNFSAADPQTPTIFSAAYQNRVGDFQAGARNILQSNSVAASDIKNSQSKISRLKTASDGTESYIGMAQAGGQISTFLSQELSKLRVDISRQIIAETDFTLNEQREREEGLLAFGQALRSWTASGSTGGSY
ncbi:MAG: hypothetical protein LBB28_01650 [Synergistaceae bacterium]|jgi:hypothetical protein|nr:hypothetical protein [Synergistaceae bacterium]